MKMWMVKLEELNIEVLSQYTFQTKILEYKERHNKIYTTEDEAEEVKETLNNFFSSCICDKWWRVRVVEVDVK